MGSDRKEIRVDGRDVEASKMLALATSTLRLLKNVEKELAKQTPGQKPLRWGVGMMSGREYGLIELWVIGDEPVLGATIDALRRAMKGGASVEAPQ